MKIPYSRTFAAMTAAWALLAAPMAMADAAACGGGPGVFSVFEGGKVAINSSLSFQDTPGTCNVSFTGSGWVNVEGDKLYGPLAQNPNENKCPIQDTDKNPTRLTLPTFPATASSPNIKIYNWNGPTSSFAITYDGETKNYNYCAKQGDKFWATCDCGNPLCQKPGVTQVGVLTLPTAGDPNASFIFNGNSFGRIETWSAPITFSGTDVAIDHLFSLNQARITLPGGRRYFVKNLELNDNYRLHVSGQGRAEFYVQNVVKMNGNGSCLNIEGNCNGNNDSFDLTAQHPERLAIYIYNGDLTLSDRTQIAASIYVDNGDLKLKANSNFSLIGEAIAKNIAVTNNAGVRMHYQDTGAFSLILPSYDNLRTGLYSLARPAVPPVANIGDYSFIAYQSDYASSRQQKNYGTLRAYALRADGTTETPPAWDANALMSENERKSKLYIDVAGTAVAINDLTLPNLTTLGFSTLGLSSSVNINDVKDRMARGPGAILPGKWNGWLGKPNDTQPLIFKDMVLFTTSDGFLYALDRQTGGLRWGWLMQALVPGYATDSAYEAMLNGAGMRGQLNVVTLNGVDYILGTAGNGAIHYGLRLDANGLPVRVWYDARSGQSSPNAEKPVVYLDKAVYIVGGKLVIRPVTGGNANTDMTPNVGGGSVTSSPTIVQYGSSHTLLLGTSNGYVMSATLNSNGSVANFNQLGYTGANEAITYVVYTKTMNYEYVTAQSKTRVTTFKRRVNTNNNWVKIWSITKDEAKEWDFASGNLKASTTLPALPEAGEITDRVTSMGGYIGIPFTLPATGDDSCEGTARLYLAALDSGLNYYAVYYFGQAFSDPYLTLGTGQAMSAQGTYLGGRMMMQGHSEKNLTGTEGLDNPLEFVPIPPNKGPGRKSWREVLVN